MNLNMKKVSVPVLMFLMSQSGFGVSNANFGNANLALAQNNEIGQARAVRCLTEEAIKKDEASDTDTEVKKLLVNEDSDKLDRIVGLLKLAYTSYLVLRNNAGAVREALKGKSSVEDMVATLVDTNLFSTDKNYLWWTIDGYDETYESHVTGGNITIKGKFYEVVKEILKAVSTTEGEGGWRDTEATEEGQAETNKKHDAELLMGAITGNDEENGGIGGLKTKDFEGEGWWTYDQGQQHTAAGEKWTSVLDAINNEIYTGTGGQRQRKTNESDINKESIIDALQVFLGDRLMDKLIDAGKTEEGDVEEALKDFFEGHFMRKVAEVEGQDISETSFENALREVNDIMSDAAGDDNDKKERIYNVTFDAIYDRIEGLLRSKDAPVSIDMFNDGGIFSDTFKKTLVNLLDNLDSTERN